MKVIDFDQEELQIKKDIEKARESMKDVEDLSDFANKSTDKSDKTEDGDGLPWKIHFLMGII